MSEVDALLARWDSFLSKIEARTDQSLAQIKTAAHDQLIDTDFDYHTVIRAMHGMVAQVDKLAEKIDQTWEDGLRYDLEALDLDAYLEGAQKANEANYRHHMKLSRFKTELEGELAEKYYAGAVQMTNLSFNCAQCGAAMSARPRIFVAQYVTCPACTSVNTFEPNSTYMMAGHLVDDMARYRALAEHDVWQNLEEQKDKQRDKMSADAYAHLSDAHKAWQAKIISEKSKLKDTKDFDEAKELDRVHGLWLEQTRHYWAET